jgi:hypothetical protein
MVIPSLNSCRRTVKMSKTFLHYNTTPVTSKALTMLRKQIEQDANKLDGPSKARLEKFANAAQKSFAECAILFDENQLLFEQNNESNCRQSTRSTMVGKAKVMSYEDIDVVILMVEKELERFELGGWP